MAANTFIRDLFIKFDISKWVKWTAVDLININNQHLNLRIPKANYSNCEPHTENMRNAKCINSFDYVLT